MIPSASSFFETYYRRAQQYEQRFKGISGSLLFDFRKSGDGFFLIRIEDGSLLPLSSRPNKDATLTIVCSFQDFYELAAGQRSLSSMLLLGRLRLIGDKRFGQRILKALS